MLKKIRKMLKCHRCKHFQKQNEQSLYRTYWSSWWQFSNRAKVTWDGLVSFLLKAQNDWNFEIVGYSLIWLVDDCESRCQSSPEWADKKNKEVSKVKQQKSYWRIKHV